MDKLLTQEEVDALLKGVSGGDIETETCSAQEVVGARVYDFTSQDRIHSPLLSVFSSSRLHPTRLSSGDGSPRGSGSVPPLLHPAFFVHLPATADSERPGGHGLGDHAARRDVARLADFHRRNQR